MHKGRGYCELQGHAADLFTHFLTRYGLTLVHRACMLRITIRCTVIILICVMRIEPLQIRCGAQAVQ